MSCDGNVSCPGISSLRVVPHSELYTDTRPTRTIAKAFDGALGMTDAPELAVRIRRIFDLLLALPSDSYDLHTSHPIKPRPIPS